jgi:predicted dehydrogenase
MDGSGGVRLGLVGIGKIARDQHLPAIAADPRFTLVATASRHAQLDDVPGYPDIEALIAAGHDLDAVSLCTPPAGRHSIARAAIDAGLHVMLEKPPAATLGEIEDLAARAHAAGVTMFATWHSREAAGVEPARTWLAGCRIDHVRIRWMEDIRRWHPGQEWILGAGGFGVFDPGINALSILTRIMPQPVLLERADLTIPAGRQSPIAATLAMRSGGTPVDAVFDFRQTGAQSWDIVVDTDRGTLRLSKGGSVVQSPGAAAVPAADTEYPRLYARFAELIAARRSDVDLAPLRLVADAMLVGERSQTDSFSF